MYPEIAIPRGSEGWVRITLTITEFGDVQDVKVIESEPGRFFDRAAKEAVKKWKYAPPLDDEGNPTEREGVETMITFVLDK